MLVIQALMKYLNPCIKELGQKLKIYACKDGIVLDVIRNYSIKILSVKENK